MECELPHPSCVWEDRRVVPVYGLDGAVSISLIVSGRDEGFVKKSQISSA